MHTQSFSVLCNVAFRGCMVLPAARQGRSILKRCCTGSSAASNTATVPKVSRLLLMHFMRCSLGKDGAHARQESSHTYTYAVGPWP